MKILRTSNELNDSKNEILQRCGGMAYAHIRWQVQSQKYELGVDIFCLAKKKIEA